MTVVTASPTGWARTQVPDKPLVCLTGPEGMRAMVRVNWHAARAVAVSVFTATDEGRNAHPGFASWPKKRQPREKDTPSNPPLIGSTMAQIG